MAAYYNRSYKVVGIDELPNGWAIYKAKKYAQLKGYSHNHVAKLCRAKRIKAYKSGGKWFIYSPSLE
ncbi:MAG: hypothetical protein ACRCVX_03515 [Shewanella sp.]